MWATTPLIISSLEQLVVAHDDLDKTEIVYQAEIIVEADVDNPNNRNCYTRLEDVELTYLFNIVQKLRCRKLTLQSAIIVMYEFVTMNEPLEDLREIELLSCMGSVPLIRLLVVRCPNLERLYEDNMVTAPYHRDDYRTNLAAIISPEIIDACTNNYRLLRFSSSSITSDFAILIKANIKQKAILEECLETMTTVPQRNLEGYQKCRAAIYQLFLIKKYRPDSVFRFINRDVILIIAKLIHSTRGTALWCQ